MQTRFFVVSTIAQGEELCLRVLVNFFSFQSFFFSTKNQVTQIVTKKDWIQKFCSRDSSDIEFFWMLSKGCF